MHSHLVLVEHLGILGASSRSLRNHSDRGVRAGTVLRWPRDLVFVSPGSQIGPNSSRTGAALRGFVGIASPRRLSCISLSQRAKARSRLAERSGHRPLPFPGN